MENPENLPTPEEASAEMEARYFSETPPSPETDLGKIALEEQEASVESEMSAKLRQEILDENLPQVESQDRYGYFIDE